MDNEDDIPSGININIHTPTNETNTVRSRKDETEQVSRTRALEEIMSKRPPSKNVRTDSSFRHRTEREDTISKEKSKNKANSEHYQPQHSNKERVMPSKVLEKPVKKQKNHVHLPAAHHKQPIKKRSETKMSSHRYHQFDRKEYHNEQIIKDIEHYPIKYKIICQAFGCKPDAAYQMPKEEAVALQEEYKRQKGIEYLRDGNAKAKYNYIRDKRIHTSNNAKGHKSHSNSKKNIRVSKSHKLIKLSAKEVVQGKEVYDRVKKHLKDSQKNPNYFKHLDSEESIDHALVSFLRTKIKRAQMSMN